MDSINVELREKEFDKACEMLKELSKLNLIRYNEAYYDRVTELSNFLEEDYGKFLVRRKLGKKVD